MAIIKKWLVLVTVTTINCVFLALNFLTTGYYKHLYPPEKDFSFKDPHIFFVETSGSASLNARQACSVESAAYHNPSMEIYALMTPPGEIDNDHELMKKLIDIRNVHLVRTRIDVLVQDSPLSKWYSEAKWNTSYWKVVHLSDGLRLFLMWKYGGAYLDLDVITLRPYKHLRNAIVAETWGALANGILFFDKGNEFIRRCIIDFADNYDAINFNANGPALMLRNVEKYCGTKSLREVSESTCDVSILPPVSAFPVGGTVWDKYFEPSSVKNISETFKSSIMMHMWNQLSKVRKLQFGNNSLYELAMKQHCPLVYSYAQKLDFI